MASTEWMTYAACATVGGDLWHSPHHEDRVAAAWVCRTRCQVREACLEDALARREPHGIRGGLSHDAERDRIARQRARQQQEAA